jgi:hypothetical protein
MEDRIQSTDSIVTTIDNMEQQWNDGILRRDVASAASFHAKEFKLVVGAEGETLQVIPRDLWLSVLPRYVVHSNEIADMHVSVWNDVAVAKVDEVASLIPCVPGGVCDETA